MGDLKIPVYPKKDALLFFGRCSLWQDCLYLVFELCEGLDLLETIRRSKNGRQQQRLGNKVPS